MTAVLMSADMMVSSRVMSAARQSGIALAIAPSIADLIGRLTDSTRLVMLDLSSGLTIKDVVASIRAAAPQGRIIAFGPHVDEALLAAARDAGCDVVMSNGQFYREQDVILRGLRSP